MFTGPLQTVSVVQGRLQRLEQEAPVKRFGNPLRRCQGMLEVTTQYLLIKSSACKVQIMTSGSYLIYFLMPSAVNHIILNIFFLPLKGTWAISSP
jgi:hypothetical protein